MKKRIILTFILINVFNLLGCSMYTHDSSEYDPHGFYPKQEAAYNEETLKKILECFDNKDVDSLIDMFSEAVKSQYDLESQIEKAFEIYGGHSVSYEGFYDHGTYTYASDNGKCVEKSIGADMMNIKTDNDEVFVIGFKKCVVNDKKPNELGIEGISLLVPNHGSLVTLAIIGPIDEQGLKILEENNQKRNGNKPSASN